MTTDINRKITNKYIVNELVSSVPDAAKYEDPNLCGCGGIAVDNDHMLWVANNGNNPITRNVSHYDMYGNRLIEKLPFIDYEVPVPLIPPSQQRQLISDLLWLQKNLLYYKEDVIMRMPKIYSFPPILGKPTNQPSPEELALATFLNTFNGHLNLDVDLSYLINYCINNPLPLKTPSGKKATLLLSNAHNKIYKELITNLDNEDLIRQYVTILKEAQKWIALGLPTAKEVKLTESETMTTLEAQISTFNDRLPIGLVYNRNKGFVGFQLNERRASCDLIAVTSKGSIYSYSPLINTTPYYGMVTVLNNSNNYSVYTGIALAENRIYVTDLANCRIEIYDFGWVPYRDLNETTFIDPTLPNDYSPFNVLPYDNELIVTYAKLDPNSQPIGNKVLTGKGFGLINIFTLDGVFVRRAVSYGQLNAPWGLTIVRNHFVNGRFMVANHGDGRILVYDQDWNYVGKLKYTNYPKSIIGLYGITSLYESLYFVSAPLGIGGLFGRLTKKKHHCICDRKRKSHHKETISTENVQTTDQSITNDAVDQTDNDDSRESNDMIGTCAAHYNYNYFYNNIRQ